MQVILLKIFEKVLISEMSPINYKLNYNRKTNMF